MAAGFVPVFCFFVFPLIRSHFLSVFFFFLSFVFELGEGGGG